MSHHRHIHTSHCSIRALKLKVTTHLSNRGPHAKTVTSHSEHYDPSSVVGTLPTQRERRRFLSDDKPNEPHFHLPARPFRPLNASRAAAVVASRTTRTVNKGALASYACSAARLRGFRSSPSSGNHDGCTTATRSGATRWRAAPLKTLVAILSLNEMFTHLSPVFAFPGTV